METSIFVFSDRFIFTAGHRTVKHMFPVFGPRLAPAHLAPAYLAGFAGQVLLVTFKCEFHPGVVVRFFTSGSATDGSHSN